MKKLSIGRTIGDTFIIYFKSLPSLFKNNWALLLAVALINAAIIFYFKDHLGVGSFSPPEHVDHIAHCFQLVMMVPIIASFLLAGYTYRYVVNKENKPLGIGGIYVNMPLIKMLVSLALVWLFLFIIFALISSVVSLIVNMTTGLVLVYDLPYFAQSLKALSANYLEMAMTGVILLIGIIFIIFLRIRLLLVAPYSFLHNEIAVLKITSFTKGNVWRILIASIVISIIYGIGIFLIQSMLGHDLHWIKDPMHLMLVGALYGLIFLVLSYLNAVFLSVMYKRLVTEK